MSSFALSYFNLRPSATPCGEGKKIIFSQIWGNFPFWRSRHQLSAANWVTATLHIYGELQSKQASGGKYVSVGECMQPLWPDLFLICAARVRASSFISRANKSAESLFLNPYLLCLYSSCLCLSSSWAQ
jgi:hypothetical protein